MSGNTTRWDPADHLGSEEARTAYREAAHEDGNPHLVEAVDGDIERAQARDGNSRLDAFHQHEVLHTAHLLQSMFEEHVEQHRYVQATPELREAADKVSAALGEFYQFIGRLGPP